MLPRSCSYVSYECFLAGALDQASVGDGRWTIAWTPVQCPVGTAQGASTFFYSFQGSNYWYLKLQIANTRCVSPLAMSVTVHFVLPMSSGATPSRVQSSTTIVLMQTGGYLRLLMCRHTDLDQLVRPDG